MIGSLEGRTIGVFPMHRKALKSHTLWSLGGSPAALPPATRRILAIKAWLTLARILGNAEHGGKSWVRLI
jgi:hypothetical protein